MAGCEVMNLPFYAGESLSGDELRMVREKAIFDLCKWDIQCEDHSVLSSFPLLVDQAAALFLSAQAEALTHEALSAEKEILQKPWLLEQLGLPRAIRRVLQSVTPIKPSPPELRVMRFDFHCTPSGWRISEVNADVPGGFIEASGWNSLFASKWRKTSAPPNTADLYARAVRNVIGGGGFVAFVHATAYSDDRQVMTYLEHSFSRHGMQTCLCSPSHLRWNGGRAEICADFASGRPDAIVRFFPAEWLPNLSTDKSWTPYFQYTETPLSNPGCAIVPQTKRFPLVWDYLRTELSTWRQLLPETRGFAESGPPLDDTWVLKPVLGRVGEGIGIRGVTPVAEFHRILQQAHRRPSEWIVQERFEILPLPTEGGPRYPCIGVFTIGGKAAGFYGRIYRSPVINQDAQDVAVLINDGPERGAN